MMDIDIVTLIAQVGFPAAIAIFVLVRLDHTLRALRDEILALSGEFRRLCEKLS